MASFLWLNFLTIPELFRLRLVSRNFDRYVTDELRLLDVTLTPVLLSSHPHPLLTMTHPLYRLLMRSAPRLRSFLYRPDLENALPVQCMRRPLQLMSLSKCFALHFPHPDQVPRFRREVPLIPPEFLVSLLITARFTLRRVSVLVGLSSPPSVPRDGSSSLSCDNSNSLLCDGSGSFEFPVLETMALIVCSGSRGLRGNAPSLLSSLISRSVLSSSVSVSISGQDVDLARAFHDRDLAVSFIEPRMSQMAQLKQLLRSVRTCSRPLTEMIVDISELTSIRCYYAMKMLQFLAESPQTHVKRLMLAVGAEHACQVIPHLVHVEHTVGLGCVNLRQVSTAIATDDTQGVGMMQLGEVLVLRDDHTPSPLYLGTVEQFAMDVVETYQTSSLYTQIDRLHSELNKIQQMHHRHFLEGTWIPHVFLSHLL
eukprot:Gregarina_sp_Poly_1__8390@NODE_492_length_7957_cov_331_107224_g396_i0_p2_GENE_NODE_492_length_7957_cov_331_107224_g396_i0NODE_492_length_7957_cov_331_107224_g396_i0_p2_ORF_typecomplete_len425_score56_18_NODE_492_length_7957_cov_331_107224_g396_i032714545